MPSFQDSAVIFVIALLLFGPKKLPELARQLGKLMGEFRRASNDFRIQMEDELRMSEQAERQKEIAAMEAAAPILPAQVYPAEEHPHLPPPPSEEAADEAAAPSPQPIATSGDLQMMPPQPAFPSRANLTRQTELTEAPQRSPPSPRCSTPSPRPRRVPSPPTPSTPPSRRPSRRTIMPDPIDRARSAVKDRAELPGMSLMEHLEELRKRLIHAVAYLAIGCAIAYGFNARLIAFIQRPLVNIGLKMTMTHPTDALNLIIKTAVVFGAIFASPFILYQVWLFISPGMYAHEKKYVFPFMGTTVALFLSGAWFGYRYVLPGAMVVLIQDMGKNFTHMITIEDYTSFFLAVILGLGVTFELPIVIFFLALFGIVDAKFLIKHIRYAILAIFLIAAIICPLPDPVSMCLFASPMLVLYLLGVGVAYVVHPERRKAREKIAA